MLPPRRAEVLRVIVEHQPVTAIGVSRLMGLAQSTVQEHVKLLLRDGLVRRRAGSWDLEVSAIDCPWADFAGVGKGRN